MKIATWNIYWLGDRVGEFITRSEADYQTIADVIRNVSPDVLALEEIVDPAVMEHILQLAGGDGRDYVIRSDGQWLTSDSNPTDESKNLQKVFLCINRETVEFLHGAKIRGGPGGGRRPYAAALRHKKSGVEFVAVALHLRSGYPAFLDEEDASFRRKEVEALALWLQGQAESENPEFGRPDSDNVVVLGDFNAQFDDPNHSLDAFREAGLSGWMWDGPKPDGNRWETAIYEGDQYVIDFIILSPTLKDKVASPPTVYAWDFDPKLGGPVKFHSGPNGSGNLKGYGVSDHRPVVTVLDFHT
jgi:endonuclease/exonuclease/phosphatase family metal-dependent hydrolase